MKESKQISRRRFLFAAGAGGAAATALVASRKQGAGDSSVTTKTSPDVSGYRLTEHIRSYYRTAKV